VANATANGVRAIASAINEEGGINAVNLRIAEQYLNQFGKLAKTNNSVIIPTDLSDIAGMIKGVTTVIKNQAQ
ncbi:MAG: band-7 C-terminal domain-containing protein, partial [Planctomycetota bacterium]|jgi:ribosome-binding ATPase YchF (GTP1/OBG family)